MTERELVQKAQSGDQDAFAQLIRDNETRIYTLALRMTGSREDAQDLAQEAFLSAWRALSSFKGDATFSTWVYRLTSNACIDHLRKQKRRQEVVQTQSLDDEERGSIDLPDRRFDPQTELERGELRAAVERGLAALPDHQRQILVMRELSGLSYQEISDVLQMDLGTVKSRIARARSALRKRLTGDGNFFSPPSSIPIE